MIVIVKGEKYEFDQGSMPVGEARLIKERTGMGFAAWAAGVSDMDPDAIVALVFLAKKRAGEAPRWSQFDDLDILKDVDMDYTQDSLTEDEPDETPVALGKPTKPKKATAGKTPSDG